MPFTALDRETSETIKSFDGAFSTKLELLKSHPNIVCPDCKTRFCVKTSTKDRLFFSHVTQRTEKRECSLNRSKAHDFSVIAFMEALNTRIVKEKLEDRYQIYIEQVFKHEGEKRRADIALYDKLEKRFTTVFEIQLSPISEQEMLSRTQFYVRRNIDCIWLFALAAKRTIGQKEFCKKVFGYRFAPIMATRLSQEDVGIKQSIFDAVWDRVKLFASDNRQFAKHWKDVDFTTVPAIEEGETSGNEQATNFNSSCGLKALKEKNKQDELAFEERFGIPAISKDNFKPTDYPLTVKVIKPFETLHHGNLDGQVFEACLAPSCCVLLKNGVLLHHTAIEVIVQRNLLEIA